MRLTDLRPQFLKRQSDHEWLYVDTAADADGIKFLCPKCFVTKGGPVGCHSVICWRPDIPQTTTPTGGRWRMVGTGYKDLTLVAGSSSVFLEKTCGAHFFIANGDVRDA